MKPPVVVIVFRRPDLTARLIEVLAKVRPEHLLVVADGPRVDRPDDVEACRATRALFDDLPWSCRVDRCFSETNLGCGRRPATGITWAFEQVEEAIILEDDCIPDPSFFRYCGELLERYRDDDRVMHISGCTYSEEVAPCAESYFFSRYPACWGWATWRRAWQAFEYNVPSWAKRRETPWLKEILVDDLLVDYWAREFDIALAGGESLTGWDYQWAYACWENSGLAISPRRNLVSNVGAGEGATHTFWDESPTMYLRVFPMPVPLTHPKQVARHERADFSFRRKILMPSAGGDGRTRWEKARSLAGRVVRKVQRSLGGKTRTGEDRQAGVNPVERG